MDGQRAGVSRGAWLEALAPGNGGGEGPESQVPGVDIDLGQARARRRGCADRAAGACEAHTRQAHHPERWREVSATVENMVCPLCSRLHGRDHSEGCPGSALGCNRFPGTRAPTARSLLSLRPSPEPILT